MSQTSHHGGAGASHGRVGREPLGERALPIPDYERLSAKQASRMLHLLSQDELRDVRAYERTHKNRKTVLDRLAWWLD